MVIIAFIPLVAFIMCISLWSIISLYKKNKKYLEVEMVATMIILFFFIHPKITEIYLSIYSCREIEGALYMIANLDIECFKGDHLYYSLAVALPSVILWVIGVPTGILMYLTKHRLKLRNIEMKLKVGFLYNGYKIRTYYWEFIILYRNVIVIIILVFLSGSDVNIQALTALVVLLISYYYHILVNPYRHHYLNELEKRGILTATITIYLGLYFLSDDFKEEYKMSLFFLILCTNMYFLIVWSVYFVHALFKESASKVGFLRKLFKQKDGFQTDFLVESHLSEKVYLDDDQKIMTLVSPGYPKHEIELPDIPESMISLYRETLNNGGFNRDYDNLTNALYFRGSCDYTSRSYDSSNTDFKFETNFIIEY